VNLKNYSIVGTTSISTLAQAPSGYHLSFVGGFLVNNSASEITVTVSIYDSSNALKVDIPFLLTASEKKDISTKIFLQPLERVKVITSADTATLTLFGAETVVDADSPPDSWAWIGAWDSSTTYYPNNLVLGADGNAYISIITSTDSEPPSANWEVFVAKGIDGTDGSYIAGTTLSMADAVISRPKLIDVSESINALGDISGGTTDIDLEDGNIVIATVSTAAQTLTFSNPPATGSNGSFILYLTNGGSQTITWPTSVDWVGATAPTLTAAGLDILVFSTNDGGTTWLGLVAGLDVK